MNLRQPEDASNQIPALLTTNEGPSEGSIEDCSDPVTSGEIHGHNEMAEKDLVPMKVTKRVPLPSNHGFYTDCMLGNAAMNPPGRSVSSPEKDEV